MGLMFAQAKFNTPHPMAGLQRESSIPAVGGGMSKFWGVKVGGVGVSLGLIISWGDVSGSQGKWQLQSMCHVPYCLLCAPPPGRPMTLGLLATV